MSDFVSDYLSEAIEILRRLDATAIERMVGDPRRDRAPGGRLFMLGVGGSAATLRMPSTISARSPASRPMPPPTTSPS